MRNKKGLDPPTLLSLTHVPGLADIDWEGACLREADLTGATFHLGSSRSGLVGSPIACEGSRTGFYTDDYDEQTFKSPEEIRKANLSGADLQVTASYDRELGATQGHLAGAEGQDQPADPDPRHHPIHLNFHRGL